MKEFLTVYQCDVCEKTAYTNDDIINVNISTPEVHEEGDIHTNVLEFDICRECARRCTISQLIEFFNSDKGSD